MVCPLRSLAVVVAFAVANVPLLPPEHIHLAGIEGRTATLVHAHEDVIDWVGAAGPRGAGLKTSHGDHGRAIFLSTTYNSNPRVAAQPVALLVSTALAAPAVHSIGITDRFNVQSTHGPPGATWLTRAPPALS
jgi:hypothetical protein